MTAQIAAAADISRGALQDALLQPLSQAYVPTIPFQAYNSADGINPMWQMRYDIPVMLTHPVVSSTLAYYKSGLAGAEMWGGPTPGHPDPANDPGLPICAENPKAATWIFEMCNRYWGSGVSHLQRGYDFGWCGGESLYDEEDGKLNFSGLKPFSPLDTDPLTKEHVFVGIRVRNAAMNGGDLDLWSGTDDIPAKGVWYAHNPVDGMLYGRTALADAWRPWRRVASKDAMETVADGGMYRFAYAGPQIFYPEETYEAPLGSPYATMDSSGKPIIYARDMARMMSEQAKAGASFGFPSATDDKGQRKWAIEWPKSTLEINGIIEYLKYLYDQIRYGIGVPPELLEAAETGSGYSGRQVPLLAFLESQQKLAEAFLSLFREQILRPLVRWNFGDVKWRVQVKPLILSRSKNNQGQQPNEQQPQGSQPGGMQQPGQPQRPQVGAAMSIASSPLMTDRMKDIARRVHGRAAA